MDLLSKFDAVAVTPGSRISAEDKAFCAAHQAAYDAARASLEKLLLSWATMQEEQQAALEGTDSSPDRYLISDSLRISASAIRGLISSLHPKLIQNLVQYFNATYHISVSSYSIEENLLPAKPDRYRTSEEQMQQYEKEAQSLSLHSDQIVEQILAQLDGRGLWDQALYELQKDCHRAAWNSYREKPEFALNKNVIRFSYGCNYESIYPSWQLTDGFKTILRGLAHYETGSFSVTPYSFSPLFGYHYTGDGTIAFRDCQKAAKLRMFKNHRVDLTFQESSYAEGFVEKYLGAVC